MKSLIRTAALKVERWLDVPRREHGNEYAYDEADDAMLLYIEKPSDRIITHYIDDSISLLYRQSDKEVVGFRISDFYKDFFPSFISGKKSIWRLYNADSLIYGRYDIELYVVPDGELYAVRANVIDTFAISFPTMAIEDQSPVELARLPRSRLPR